MDSIPSTLDHLVLATPDVDEAARWLDRETGVLPSPGGQHVGRGSRNVLCSLGPTSYLEIVGPDPDQPRPARPRPFGIDDLTGPALVAWAIRVDDIATFVEVARVAGFDPGDQAPMERRRPDGIVLRWRLTEPRSTTIPFLIDWGRSPHPAATAAPGLVLDALEARHPDPPRLERILGALGVTIPIAAGSEVLVARLHGPRGAIAFP